jgi:hypothetical protein
VNGFLFQGSVDEKHCRCGWRHFGGERRSESYCRALNARIYGTFTGTKVYGLGLLANVNAKAFLESPVTCTEVEASATAEAMVTGTYATASKTLDPEMVA